MSRVAKDAITNQFLGKEVVRLEDIDHGNYKFFNQSTIDNIVELTKNNCKAVKNTSGAYTSISFQISIVMDYNLHDMMQLAYYGWTVSKVSANKVALISYKACKLQAISKQISKLEVKHISVSRFDGNDLLNTWNGANKDIIKTCQKEDRHFNVKVVTDRPNKVLLKK